VNKACDLCGAIGHLKASCALAAADTECWDFQKGSCKRGDRCGFAHGGVPPNPPPARTAPGEAKTCHVCGQLGHLRADCPFAAA